MKSQIKCFGWPKYCFHSQKSPPPPQTFQVWKTLKSFTNLQDRKIIFFGLCSLSELQGAKGSELLSHVHCEGPMNFCQTHTFAVTCESLTLWLLVFLMTHNSGSHQAWEAPKSAHSLFLEHTKKFLYNLWEFIKYTEMWFVLSTTALDAAFSN